MKKYLIVPSLTVGGLSALRQYFHDRILANRYLLHNVLLLGANVLAGIFAYLLHPFLGHIMSIQEYGEVAVLIAFALVLTTPTQIISTVAARYTSSLSTSENHAQLNDFIRRLTAILLIVGVVVTAIFIATSGYVTLFFHLNSRQEVILLGLIFIVTFATPLNMGTIQGLENFNWFAVITLLPTVLRLVISIGFVLMGFGVNGVMLGIVMSAVVPYLISFLPLRRVLRGPRAPIGSLRSLWSYSILASVVTASIVILFNLDTVLTRHFLSADEAGLYAALATIGRTVLLITTGVTTVMFPRVVALYERGEPYRRVVIQSVLGVLLLSSVIEIAFYLAPSLITQVLFGPAFVAISGQLVSYGMAMLLLAVAVVIINYFLAIGNRPFVIIVFLACAVQAGLIIWHHGTIAQVVQTVLVTNVALVFALLIAFGVSIWKPSHKKL
jgi:O-antigen/teichoic acid export membrane protein